METGPTNFETAIKNFLDNLAKEDEMFAKTYAKENKSIKECCQYIYGEVGKMRENNAKCVALSDEEVFGLAIHYYDEDDIKVANGVVKPSTVKASATETPAPEQKPKTRKPRKPKTEVVEDSEIPAPFEIPLF